MNNLLHLKCLNQRLFQYFIIKFYNLNPTFKLRYLCDQKIM